MTAQEYLDAYQGQSLLYNTNDPTLRGQCVQAVCFFTTANNCPVAWADAYYWKDLASQHPDKYEWIANTPGVVPAPGDIVIWDRTLPGSAAAGHIAVCLRPLPGTGTFVSVDQNWGGKTVHAVTHNYSYVIGWLRIKQALEGGRGGGDIAAPAPAPAPTTQGDEMIADTNQAHEAYQLLRPNGDGSDAEINATAGHRSWAQFANDAKPEVAARNANLQQQAQHIAAMSDTINITNQTITDLRTTIQNEQATNGQKQQALDAALTKIAQGNAQMTSLHDQLSDLQKKLSNPLQSATAVVSDAKQKSGGLFVAFLRFLLSPKFTKKPKQ
jgi:prefoldin subunit 5